MSHVISTEDPQIHHQKAKNKKNPWFITQQIITPYLMETGLLWISKSLCNVIVHIKMNDYNKCAFLLLFFNSWSVILSNSSKFCDTQCGVSCLFGTLGNFPLYVLNQIFIFFLTWTKYSCSNSLSKKENTFLNKILLIVRKVPVFPWLTLA